MSCSSIPQEESRLIALVNLDDEVPDPSVLETLSAKVDELFSEIKQTLEDDRSRRCDTLLSLQ